MPPPGGFLLSRIEVQMKKLCITVFVLTLLDATCTVSGVQNQYITEANPLLQCMMQYPVITGVLVAVCVGALLYLVYRNRKPWMVYAMVPVLCVKVGVVCLHVDWIYRVWPPYGGIFMP